MNLRLALLRDDDGCAILRATRPLRPSAAAHRTLRYATRTGASLRVDGVTCGAFDREHETIVVPGALAGEVELAVERRALPATGLPAGDGLRWRRMVARAAQAPSLVLRVGRARVRSNASPRAGGSLPIVGHSHLDVAWLWTYADAARKAVRTFATAVRQLELDDAFVFTQSQPQLYAFVRDRDPELFARVATFARAGRFDASGAAMWVEADCQLPSGEALLRQLIVGCAFVSTEFGVEPTVAWLPDSFGFPNTLPTLLRHAGIGAFGTTKLGWNDTTTFPHPRFVWEGPDGSCVIAAQIGSIAGGVARPRVRRARARGDLLLVGEGDGGGGASDGALAAASRVGTWTTLGAWFSRVERDAPALPVVRDELFLEEHRGIATTHHDLKSRAAALERALRDADELLAWAYALRATPFFVDEARGQLARAWEALLRAHFHDVVPGSAIGAVYADALAELDDADALVAHVAASARSILPSAAPRADAPACAPRRLGDDVVFENASLYARVRRDGTIVELAAAGGRNLVRRANRLAAYVDRPARWDAWNVDRSYRSRPRRVRDTGHALLDDALETRHTVGTSPVVRRVSLLAHEPFLRVEMAIAWAERHVLVRSENELSFAGTRARFGTPHGTVDRAAAPRTRAERAKYEAIGQRYARIDGDGDGLAIFALDTYGWSVDRRRGRTQLGHSLLRAPAWPDPGADRGEHAFSLAYAPLGAAGAGELEAAWERFARAPSVAMFVSDDPRIVVVAVKLAQDGAGVIVRARECDGAAVTSRLRCGARALGATCVDARERPVAGDVALEEAAIVAPFAPFELRSFRVRVR